VFLVGPCRFYLYGEASGGTLSIVFVLGMLAVAVGIGGIGALVALVAGKSAGDFFWNWAIAGLVVVVGWLIYVLLLMAVLWALGRSPQSLAEVEPSAPSARHAGPTEELSWRRRGRDPLVPASLAGFFALMAAFLFGGSLLTSFEERPYAGEKVVVTAELLRYDDGKGGLGKRHLIVRYPMNDKQITASVRADDADPDISIPKPGASIDIEYPAAHPAKVRPAGAAHRAHSDITFDRTISLICTTLAALTLLAHLVGRKRRPT
jgi:hypothetical protein